MTNNSPVANESLIAGLQAQPKGKKSGKRKGYYKKYKATRKPSQSQGRQQKSGKRGRDDYYSEC